MLWWPPSSVWGRRWSGWPGYAAHDRSGGGQILSLFCTPTAPVAWLGLRVGGRGGLGDNVRRGGGVEAAAGCAGWCGLCQIPSGPRKVPRFVGLVDGGVGVLASVLRLPCR